MPECPQPVTTNSPGEASSLIDAPRKAQALGSWIAFQPE